MYTFFMGKYNAEYNFIILVYLKFHVYLCVCLYVCVCVCVYDVSTFVTKLKLSVF